MKAKYWIPLVVIAWIAVVAILLSTLPVDVFVHDTYYIIDFGGSAQDSHQK